MAKVFVEEVGETFDMPDGLTNPELLDLVEENVTGKTRFRDGNNKILNKFEAEERQQLIDNGGIIESKTPNFYRKWVVPFFRELGVQTGDFKKPKGVPAGQIFAVNAVEFFTGADLDLVTEEEQAEAPVAAFGGALVGGVGSLITVGKFLSITQLPTQTAKLTALIAQTSPRIARFIPGAIMSGSTFGTQTFITESIGQAQKGEFDIEKLSGAVFQATGLGITLGGLSGFQSKIFSISGAGAIGFTFSKSQGADNTEALLHAGIFSIFEAVASLSRTEQMNRQALLITENFIARYLLTRNPNIGGTKGSRDLARLYISNYFAPAGGVEKVVKDKRLLLENLELLNQRILQAAKKDLKAGKKPIAVEGPVGEPAVAPEPVKVTVKPTEPAPTAKPPVKFSPTSPEVKPAIELAKQFTSVAEFENAIFLPENAAALRPVAEQSKKIVVEEAARRFGIDIVALEKAITPEKPRLQIIAEQKGVSVARAKEIDSALMQLARDIQDDAIEQIFVRAVAEKTPEPSPVPQPIEPTTIKPAVIKKAITSEAQQLIDITQQQLPQQQVQDAIALAEKIALADNEKEITAKAFSEALSLKDAESFVSDAISRFPTETLTPTDQLRFAKIFGKDPVARIQEARKEFQQFTKTNPDKTELEREIKSLQKKFVKTEKPEVPKPTVLREGEPVPEPARKKPTIKKRKNTDDFPKSKEGNPVIYNVTVGNEVIPVEASSKIFDDLQPIDFPELVLLTKQILGKLPAIQKRFKGTGTRGQFSFIVNPFTGSVIKESIRIDLNPDLFLPGNEQRLALVLAHELGHLIDFLPDEIIRGSNLLGRLLVIRGFLKNTFGEKQITNKKLRKEMMDLSEIVRPLDRTAVSGSHIAYREQPEEIYADFVSVLFNSPGFAEKKAPNAMKLFFEALDKKPEVKEAYIQMQKLFSGIPENILKNRTGIIRDSFMKGESLREQLNNIKKLKNVNFWEALHDLVVESNGPVLRQRSKIEAKGNVLPRKGNPIYELQEDSLADSENYLMVADLDNTVFHPLTEAGIDKMVLGEYVFLKRVVGRPDIKSDDFKGLFEELDVTEKKMVQSLIKNLVDRGFKDRKEIANPFGFAPKTAQEQLDFMKKNLGDEQFKFLEQKAKRFHDIVFRSVRQAVVDGTYSQQIFSQVIEPNQDFYVSFGVLNYLQQFVPAGVKMQEGTLQDIENPVITTILKMIALNRWNSKNRAMRAIVKSSIEIDPTEVIQLKVPKGPKGIPLPERVKAPQGKGIITVFQNGKPIMFAVDKSIADMVENDKVGNLQAIAILDTMLQNEVYKNIFITYNVAFAFISNPQRDFRRTLKSLQALGEKVPFWQLLREYWKAFPSARKFAKGEFDETVTEMMKIKALNKPFVDFSFHPDTDPLTRTLTSLDILKGRQRNPQGVKQQVADKFLKLFEAIRFGGSTVEVVSKIAGYNLLKRKKLSDKERAYLTRNFIGTPNFLEGGKVTSTTNRIAMFSNIFIRDYTSNIVLGKTPESRNGWWWNTLRWNLLPTFIQWMARIGLLGAGLGTMYEKISEYDLTNYHNIPLGTADDGRVFHVRLFQDDIGRLLSGVLWKTLMAASNEPDRQNRIGQIFDFGAGQIPSLAPNIKVINAWKSYLTGDNPYDSFRGRYAIPEREWKAGGFPRAKKMVRWTLDNTGVGQYIVEQDRRDDFFEALVRHNFFLNRLIKLSDSGLNQQLREIREAESKEAAQLSIQKEDAYRRNVKEFEKTGDLNAALAQIQREVFPGETVDIEDRRKIKAGFLIFVQREQDNTFVNALLGARSNKNKVKILLRVREQMSPEEFSESLKFYRKHDVISADVRTQLNRVLRKPELLEDL